VYARTNRKHSNATVSSLFKSYFFSGSAQ